MNIIIEGCDGVGKSTLVEKLKKHYKVDSIRLSYKDPKDYNFYSRILDKTDCIFDRSFLSELVYSPVFGRECQLTEDEVSSLYLQAQKMKIFILNTDTDEIYRRLYRRGDEHYEIMKNIENIQQRFIELSETFNIEVIDTSKMTLQDVIERVDSHEKYQSKQLKQVPRKS